MTSRPLTPAPSSLRSQDGPHKPPPREEHEALLLVATRLKSAHPTADPAVVDALVETAYDELRDARVRTFIPILVERRARTMLAAPGPGAA